MEKERTSPAARSRMTRRRVLALGATSVLAGCSGLAGLDGGNEPTVRAYDLPDIDADGWPEPVVSESVPVEIAATHFDAARNRVTTLLAQLPTPLGPADIPNGHVREHLSTAGADATAELDDARDAPTELVALDALQRARAEARYAAAGWAVADRNLPVDPLRQEHRQAVSEALSALDAHEYVGADPVRATLVHARIEDALTRVVDNQVSSQDGNHLLSVAGWGETAEMAQARVDGARHLDEQFAASLPDDAGTIEETLTDAAETLLADVRSRKTELPPEPTVEEWDIPERVISDLRRDADDRPTRLADASGPAGVIIETTKRLTQFEALNAIQKRIDDDDLPRPQSAEAVREIRVAAYDALKTALAESPDPEMTRTAVTSAAWRVAGADRDLSRYEGDIPVSRLDSEIVDYYIATAIGRAAPDVSGQIIETIERA